MVVGVEEDVEDIVVAVVSNVGKEVLKVDVVDVDMIKDHYLLKTDNIL